MASHPELELLSAFLDGELETDETALVETHVPGCSACRETLDSLRATLADLAALADPEPTAEDSWALRSAIARARRRPNRVAAVAMAASGVAAALVGTLVATSGRPPAQTDLAVGGGALDAEAAGRPAVVERSADYTADTSGALLVRNLGRPELEVPLPATASVEERAPQDYGKVAPASRSDAHAARVAECEASSIFATTREPMRPIDFEAARFNGTPAYLLVYMVPAEGPTRLELWVLAREDCSVLLFRQQAL